MSDYSKIQNFTSLQGTTPADPSIFDTEFAAVATASATKVDKTGATMTGALTLITDTSTASAAGGASKFAVPANMIYMHAFPTGTVMPFFQASAPIGWTQNTSYNDYMLRVVSSAGGGSGGSSSPISPPSTTGSHALTIAEMPAHTHTNLGLQNDVNGTVGSSGHWAYYDFGTQSTALNTGSTGSGSAHSHTFTWAPKYINVILCSKD